MIRQPEIDNEKGPEKKQSGHMATIFLGFWPTIISFCRRHVSAIVIAALAAALVLTWAFMRSCSNPPLTVSVSRDNRIDLTPEEVRSVEQIGQWEFLSVSTEEMVDTLERSLFAEHQLVRIYRSTLRFGIDMHKVKAGWATAHGDTATLRLPRVALLDSHFIDEANTRSFYEKGQWSPAAREALYRKAERKMLRRCCTQENLVSAEANARQQMTALFRSFGFAVVEITFE